MGYHSSNANQLATKDDTKFSITMIQRGKRIVCLLLPLVLIAMPTSWLEVGRPSFCLIKALTGRPCPGCGMTRAVSSVLHGDFKKAWRYNKLVVPVFPLLFYLWLRTLLSQQ